MHSTADTDALHVRFADEKVCIGPPPARQSYLHVPAIISAAEVTGADAVHPGYGFLAENADFAEVVKKCGLHWIGPRPEVMRLMGDKVSARAAMEKAGVPTLPGTGVIETDAQAEEAVERIGLPVIIKASAGGGGRGMKIVENKTRLCAQLAAARSEAQAGFGNPNVYLERYIEPPAPHRGAGAGRRQRARSRWASASARSSAATRSWSRRRRRSRWTTSGARELLGIARKATESIGYETVGTHEFLLDEDKNFYFMEMNTRIQVEHTVTEEVFGVDLVREQMRLAAGEPLKLATNIRPRGHAIEVRVNAEDPVTFAPSPGRITGLHKPGGLGVRVDSHIYNQYVVPPFYDSLLAKLIVHAENRPAALAPAAARAGRVRHRGDQDQHRLLQAADPERRIRGG